MNDKVVAVIDLGSNSIRMTIARICKNGTVEELANYRETVRISTGLKETGEIAFPAFERTVHALQSFCKRMLSFGVEEVYALATEALRRANNRETFVAYVKEQTDICFQIISGEEEARYDFLGVSEGRPIQDCILLDTGGGSTEYMHIENGALKQVVSLPLGAVVLTEGFLKTDPPTEQELDSMHKYIQEQLEEKAPWIYDCKGLPIFAIGGTNRAMMKLKKKKEFHPNELQQLYDGFKSMGLEDRKNSLGEFQDRADIVIGGLSPLADLIRAISPSVVYVSEKGLRDGFLYQLAKNG